MECLNRTSNGKIVEGKYRESTFRHGTQARSPRVWKYMATGLRLLGLQSRTVGLGAGRTERLSELAR